MECSAAKMNGFVHSIVVCKNVIFLSIGFFGTGFFYVALAVLELSVDQAGLELRDQPASVFQLLELKACTITAWLKMLFLKIKILI